MKKSQLWGAVCACAINFLSIAPAGAVTISFGSYTFDGSGLPGGDLGSAISNPSNFSNFGYSSFTDAGEVAFGSATSSYLSSVDIFFTDRSGITSSPSASDITNLVSFVNDGGVLIINNDRSTSFTTLDPLLNAFGIDLISAPTDSIVPLTITNGSHPIMEGPFGQVNAMGLRDASRYSAIDPSVDILATWPNGDGAIAILGPSGSRKGAVIALPDVERFLLDFDSPLGTGNTDVATLNAISYAVSVATVPIPGAVWLFGSGLLGLIGIARRKKAA